MMDAAQAGVMLAELGRHLGLGDLVFDERRRCALAVDGGATHIDLRFVPRLGAIELTVDFGEVELSPARLEAMLMANFGWRGAGGAAFAVDPLSSVVVLRRRCFEAELAHGGLCAAFDQMVRHARLWPARLAETRESPARAVEPGRSVLRA